MKNNYVMSIVFSILCGITSSIRLSNILLGVITGVLVGIVFLLFMTIVTFMTKKSFLQKENELINEKIILSGLANLSTSGAPSSGWIMLSESKITFVPHRLNWKRTVTEISRSDILEIEIKKSLGVIENILKIHTTNQEYRVVIDQPNKWHELLKKD